MSYPYLCLIKVSAKLLIVILTYKRNFDLSVGKIRRGMSQKFTDIFFRTIPSFSQNQLTTILNRVHANTSL